MVTPWEPRVAWLPRAVWSQLSCQRVRPEKRKKSIQADSSDPWELLYERALSCYVSYD